MTIVMGARHRDPMKILPKDAQLIRLFMPLTGTIYENFEYPGDPRLEQLSLNGYDLLDYQKEILDAVIARQGDMVDESERGLMDGYDEDDTLNRKVYRIDFTVIPRDGQLWGVAECCVAKDLTAGELSLLIEFVEGQASDGFGEVFEQYEIRLEEGVDLYVNFFSDKRGWAAIPENLRFPN